MHYVGDKSINGGPRGPAPDSGRWAVFVAGQVVRCPSCDKGLGEVRGGVVIKVRLERSDPGACGLLHRCRSCRDYLEIRQVNADREEAA